MENANISFCAEPLAGAEHGVWSGGSASACGTGTVGKKRRAGAD
jgi:hypothetical protein